MLLEPSINRSVDFDSTDSLINIDSKYIFKTVSNKDKSYALNTYQSLMERASKEMGDARLNIEQSMLGLKKGHTFFYAALKLGRIEILEMTKEYLPKEFESVCEIDRPSFPQALSVYHKNATREEIKVCAERFFRLFPYTVLGYDIETGNSFLVPPQLVRHPI